MHIYKIACLGGLVVVSMVGCEKPVSEQIDDIYQLKMDPTPANIAQLRDLLETSSPDVRVTALNSLVTLDVEDAAELAVTALEDDDAFVRATASR